MEDSVRSGVTEKTKGWMIGIIHPSSFLHLPREPADAPGANSVNSADSV
jgi:hypothetical protein